MEIWLLGWTMENDDSDDPGQSDLPMWDVYSEQTPLIMKCE